MADEAMTATSPAPTAPPTAEVDTNTQEDVPMQEAEPSVDKGTKAAVEPEGTFAFPCVAPTNFPTVFQYMARNLPRLQHDLPIQTRKNKR